MKSFQPACLTKHLQLHPNRDIVYHYAPKNGLLGIIKNRELWASQVQYMNDSTEYNAALKIADNILDGRIDSADLDTRNIINKMKEMIQKIGDVGIFACCFCEDGDVLSQWRGYSGGGYGFSIGLRATELAEIGKNNNTEFQFAKCIYCDALQKEAVEEICDHCLSPAVVSPGEGSGAAPRFVYTLMRYAAFFKDRSFAEENEWRLVSLPVLLPDSHVDFRAGRSMLVPYYKLPLGTSSNETLVDHVVVGPCPHQALSRRSVLALLQQNRVRPLPTDTSEVRVRCSKIPYRDW